MINLGDKVKDSVTGYTGIVTSRTEWLNGCNRIGIQAAMLKDGTIRDSYVVDEPQAVLIKRGTVKRGGKSTGGPIPKPIQAKTPDR